MSYSVLVLRINKLLFIVISNRPSLHLIAKAGLLDYIVHITNSLA